MSQIYETMYILRPDLSEDQVQQEISRYRDFLSENSAENITAKVWGKRRLAYPIKRYSDGVYVLMNYEADGKQIAPLERNMRLSEEVIRYLTLKLDGDQPIAIDPPPEPTVAPPAPKIMTEPPKIVRLSSEVIEDIPPAIEDEDISAEE
jgi:small subunit ribosomal protein S6